MGNRTPGGYVFGERSKPKTEGAENVLIYQIAQNVGRFGFVDACWRSSCRLAPTLFTKKAWQSVAHLTIHQRKKTCVV
ncbi:MAG: hypothetical protein LBQ66_06670 [Planctomycetaceae bacterium]|nr:hypothetical protein [Planctomycetaceae bacterium]